MLVMLERTAFIDGVRYKKSASGTEMPEALKDRLPKGAKILDKAPEPAPKSKPKALSQLGPSDHPEVGKR